MSNSISHRSSAITILLAMSALCSSAIAAPTLKGLASLDVSIGAYCYASLAADASGNLYGTTEGGGEFFRGSVFKFNVSTNALSVVHSFSDGDGAYLDSKVAFDSAGNLFGVTPAGGSGAGTLFRVDHTSGDFETLYQFGSSDGAQPRGGVYVAPNGTIFGTTFSGGDSGNGTVFKYDQTTQQLTTLQSFTGASGANPGLSPRATLVPDGRGHLYGACQSGGPNDFGTVYRIDMTTGDLTTLATFNSANGGTPAGGVVIDAAGNVYGTTRDGGANGGGILYKIDGTTGTLKTLINFTSSIGTSPRGTLIVDSKGTLFGTTYSGGASSRGTVFSYNPNTNAFATLGSFTGTSNGSRPYGGLIADAAGNLFGATYSGGTSSYGMVYEVTGSGFVVPEPASLLAIAGVSIFATRRARR